MRAASSPLEYVPIATLAWTSDSTVLTVDHGEQQVVEYSRDARERRRFGRMGSGPGEFAGAEMVSAAPGGGFVVADARLLRVSRFDAVGTYHTSVSLPGYPLRLLCWQGDRMLVMWTGFNPSGPGPILGEIDWSRDTVVSRFSVFEIDSALAIPVPGLATPSPFIAAAAASFDRVLLASPQVYRFIAVTVTGETVDSFGRPELEEQHRSEAEIEEEQRRLLRALPPGMSSSSPPIRQLVSRLEKDPKPFFTVVGVTVDPDGRLWVATTRGTPDSAAIDLFSPTGTFVQTLKLPGTVRSVAVQRGQMAALIEDGEGFVRLHILDILPGAARAHSSPAGRPRTDASRRERVAPEFSTPSSPPDTAMTTDQNAHLGQLARILTLLGEGMALPKSLAGAGGRRLRVIEDPAPGIRLKLLDESQPDRFPATILFSAMKIRAPDLPEDVPFVPGITLALTTFPETGRRTLTWWDASDPETVLDAVVQQLREAGWSEVRSQSTDVGGVRMKGVTLQRGGKKRLIATLVHDDVRTVSMVEP